MVIKIQIGNPELLSEGFATVFKVADVVTVPDNAQRVGFVKADNNFSLIPEQGNSVWRMYGSV